MPTASKRFKINPKMGLFFILLTGKLMITIVQWNLIIKRSDITKPSYNKVILLGPSSLYFFVFLP